MSDERFHFQPTIPILRIELEAMRHQLCVALANCSKEFNDIAKDAFDRYLNDGHMKTVIENETYRVLDIAIKEEINNFYRYGEGRTIIAEKVKEKLLKRETYTVLDGDDHVK